MASTYTSHADVLDAHETLHSTFRSGKTKNLAWRKWQLKQCWWLLHENTEAIVDAITKDLNRHAFESKWTEILTLKNKILETINRLEQWAAPVKPSGNGVIFGTLGKAHVRREPLGVALVIGTWNFPFVTSLEPMLAAIAAGNCVLLKPSEIAIHSSVLLVDLINKYLDPSAIRVVTGGAAETTKILELKYNVILYTGNGKVGRLVAAAAAKHLTPCILELGGQGPAIVTKTADISLAAKRIAHSKFMNAGQICLSANHVLVDPAVHDEFVEKLLEWFKVFFANGPREQYSRIISERQFDRLVGVLGRTKGKIVRGGESDRQSLWLDPAVVTEVDLNDSLLEDELFGPILPVIKADYKEAIRITAELSAHPLGLYVFGKDQAVIDEVLNNTNSGGVTLNDCLMHSGVPNAPFGGVGESGYGAFHGEAGILAFSHQRTVFAPPNWFDKLMSWRYPPYDMANIVKTGTPTKVSFKKGETMEDQKIKTLGWSMFSAPVLGAALAVGAALSWRVVMV